MSTFVHTPVFSRRAGRALPGRQRGVTLIELMVGLFIGLMVVGIAGAALMASRGISGTVSDASGIQQQAAYAMRVIGLQLRQTGSLYLNLNPKNIAGNTGAETMAAVGLEIQGNLSDVIISESDRLNVQFARYVEPSFTGIDTSPARNCIGLPADSSEHKIIQSEFSFDSLAQSLRCGGNGGNAAVPLSPSSNPQPLVGNVRDFQVRYLMQDKGNSGNPTVAYLKAEDVDDVEDGWDKVQAVEVCLVLFGDERIDIPADSKYKGCDGIDKNYIDNKMHLLFRNVYQLRSQGLLSKN